MEFKMKNTIRFILALKSEIFTYKLTKYVQDLYKETIKI